MIQCGPIGQKKRLRQRRSLDIGHSPNLKVYGRSVGGGYGDGRVNRVRGRRIRRLFGVSGEGPREEEKARRPLTRRICAMSRFGTMRNSAYLPCIRQMSSCGQKLSKKKAPPGRRGWSLKLSAVIEGGGFDRGRWSGSGGRRRYPCRSMCHFAGGLGRRRKRAAQLTTDICQSNHDLKSSLLA